MLVADHVSDLSAVTEKNARRPLRIVCRLCVLALVACQLWVGRYIIDADGTAYVDVASRLASRRLASRAQPLLESALHLATDWCIRDFPSVNALGLASYTWGQLPAIS